MTEPLGLPGGARPRCTRWADVGPYVVGALATGERLAFEAHLPTCAACRRSVDELAALPGWLDLVPSEVVGGWFRSSDLEPGERADVGPTGGDLRRIGAIPERLVDDLRADPGPPPALLPDLLRVVQRGARRTRRRRAWAASVAVAAVLAVAVLLSAGTLHLPWLPSGPTAPSSSPAVEAEAIELLPLGDSPVTASVRLEPVAWGTRIDLTCQYGPGAVASDAGPYGDVVGSYGLVLRDAQGRTEEVATWAGVVGGPMRVPASTVMSREQIVEVELQGPDGAALLRAEV